MCRTAFAVALVVVGGGWIHPGLGMMLGGIAILLLEAVQTLDGLSRASRAAIFLVATDDFREQWERIMAAEEEQDA